MPTAQVVVTVGIGTVTVTVGVGMVFTGGFLAGGLGLSVGFVGATVFGATGFTVGGPVGALVGCAVVFSTLGASTCGGDGLATMVRGGEVRRGLGTATRGVEVGGTEGLGFAVMRDGGGAAPGEWGCSAITAPVTVMPVAARATTIRL